MFRTRAIINRLVAISHESDNVRTGLFCTSCVLNRVPDDRCFNDSVAALGRNEAMTVNENRFSFRAVCDHGERGEKIKQRYRSERKTRGRLLR